MAKPQRREAQPAFWLSFFGGACAAGVGLALYQAMKPRRRILDPRLIHRHSVNDDIPPTLVVPGIMGSGLLREDGTRVWLNLLNAMGQYNLGLPLTLPLTESRDGLRPGALLGTDAYMPRFFGFTEYYDLLDLLTLAGFRAAHDTGAQGLVQHVFAYDWRRDLVESARRLHETMEALADARGDRNTRFNVVGHSMGGLIARYYLRYGTAEPGDGPVTWAGARRIANLVLVGVPNTGGVHALEALLTGSRVGLSYTTLASSVVARMPSVYQLLPPREARALLDHKAEPLDYDVHDLETWKQLGWGPFAGSGLRRQNEMDVPGDTAAPSEYLDAVLKRAAAFQQALFRRPESPCPTRVVILGGDCMPTLARAIVSEKPGTPPRFEPLNRVEADAMFEAGDGRVTRASVLGSHLPGAEDVESGAGFPEVGQSFFGSADHHGIYQEPTFQSILLRLLLKPVRKTHPVLASGGAPVRVGSEPDATGVATA
jgi:pimeloyl-ACP methyl ester carboxylesterase